MPKQSLSNTITSIFQQKFIHSNMEMNITGESSASQEIASNPRRLTIAHLNNDCLEKVFSYLNLTDLTNVAESNVHLAISASNLFSIKYKEIAFNCFDNTMSDETFLLILQHFGESILKLRVEFCGDSKRNIPILEAIIKNCAASIREIAFGYIRNGMVVDRIFPKLEKLELFDSALSGVDSSIIELGKWFPALHTLKVVNVALFWRKFVVEQYPTLENFGYFAFPASNTMEDSISLAQFLQLNPQLKSLGMDEINGLSIEDFDQHAPAQLPNIECLDVVAPHPFPMSSIEFPSLRNLRLSFYNISINHLSDTFDRLPKSIEVLELQTSALSSSGFNYILSCQNLAKLKLTISEPLEVWQMEELANKMQSLTEIHICMKNSSSKIPPGFEHLFGKSNQLKMIRLEYEQSTFDVTDTILRAEAENVREHMNAVNDQMTSNWKMSHQAHDDDDYRSRMLTSTPFLQINFQKVGAQ